MERHGEERVRPIAPMVRAAYEPYTATLSDFWLNRFEITVGRLRAFVDAYPGSRPKAGDGAHPRIAGSGWNPAWHHAPIYRSVNIGARCARTP
jgi:hypothetical protein